MKSTHTVRGLLARAPIASAVALALLAAPAAQAFEFQKGGLTGSLDTTVSYGISIRAQEQDPDLIGKAYFNPASCFVNVPLGPLPLGASRCGSSGVPGSLAQVVAPGRFSVNRDDGDLKYDKGDAFSNAIKVTSELSLKWGTWGAFTRASYFYDFENANRDDLTPIAREKVGQDFRLLDAFVYHDFQIGEHKGSFRIGRQAVSWGESTFIQNGINVINPIDVSRLRVAGAELKEAFLPIDMLWGSFSFTDNLSMEALYMLEFEEIEVDPSGTYFSSNDFASPGGTYVMLGFGTVPQPVLDPDRYFATCKLPLGSGFGNADSGLPLALQGTACGNSVPRLPNRNARDSGQFGVAVHYFADWLHDTDFGFYFLNYHSRLPLLSGRTVSTAALAGVPPGLTAGFFVEYPEDIHMYGMSWNTSLPWGVAWQGEISYRPNMPLQVDDVELLFAALSPLNTVVPALIATPGLRFCSQLNPGCTSSPFGVDQRGYRRHQVSQLQMTFTKAYSSVLGAEQLALVGEIGATEVWDLPDQSVLRYEGEGTDTGGGPDVNSCLVYATSPGGDPFPVPASCPPGALRNPATLRDGFPTQFSWGYRVAARADYNSVFGSPFTLSPRIAFNHDVNGTTPGPGGNFLEGRKSGTLGLEANYLNKFVFDLSYTAFFGGGRGATTARVPVGGSCGGTVVTAVTMCEFAGTPFNQIGDRDFYSFTAKYSF
jgi:hypothetical protein